MAKYNVHGGHNAIVPGASGKFSEVTEDRKVKNKVIALLREKGNTVYDCTDDVGKTQSQNLSNIVKKCNAHQVDLDISIHFNAFNGQASGVEVLQYDDKTKEVAQRICSCISKLGFQNRGVKARQDLYVLKNTKAKAILVECCFCDSEQDAKIYTADNMAKAIVEGILGESVSVGETTSEVSQTTPVSSNLDSQDIDVEYAVMIEGGEVLPTVKNRSDFAGIRGKKIVGLAMKVSKGSLKYRVTTVDGTTYPWVTGYNWKDTVNGWAGDGRRAIAKVECYLYAPNADHYIFYRVSALNKEYYPYQRDTDKNKEMDGFAGTSGNAIDRFQAYVD